VPFDRLAVVSHAGVLARATATGSPCSARIEADLTVPTSGWLTARCWKNREENEEEAMTFLPAAQTSPGYIQVEGHPQRYARASVTAFIRELDEMLHNVADAGIFENARHRHRLVEIFQAARDVLLRRT